MVNLTIRPFRPPDAPGLLAAIDAVCAERRWMPGLRYEPTPTWDHALQSPDCPVHRLLVAQDGARLAGWCRVFPATCDNGHSEADLGMGLLPPYRNRGIGTALLHASIDWARDAGLARITLETYRDNHRAIHVFRKCGFEPTGRPHKRTLEMATKLGV